jgi:hypothetical protein
LFKHLETASDAGSGKPEVHQVAAKLVCFFFRSPASFTAPPAFLAPSSIGLSKLAA